MNRILLYFIVFLIILFLITLDSYSYKGIELFKKGAQALLYPLSYPFFSSFKSINSFLQNFNERKALISTIQQYANKLIELRQRNILLENQLSVYKYIISSYSNFSSLPHFKAGIYQVTLLMNDIYLLDHSFNNAYAIDQNGNFVGIIVDNKLFTIYSMNFKCKISINGSDEYGILQRSNGKFVFKYLQTLNDGKVYFCDENLQIPIGQIRNGIFSPYFKMKYIPRVIVLWRSKS